MADAVGGRGDKAADRTAQELITAYHQEQLRRLLEHVRAGLARLDAGEIDEFELDDLVHHYKGAAAELRKFCGSTGSQMEQAASMLKHLRDRGDEPDWWERGPRGREARPPS